MILYQNYYFIIICLKMYNNLFDNRIFVSIKKTNWYLHLHEIVERLYFHFSLSVCVSVCLSVFVSGSFLVNKIPAERMHRFGRGFR